VERHEKSLILFFLFLLKMAEKFLYSRKYKKENTIINLNKKKIGGKEIIVIAGPCAVENKKQIIEIAKAVKKTGAKFLRGGAFKPRTSPYSFQGLEEEGLRYLAEAREKTNLLIVTEVMDTKDVKLVEKYSDIIQIGARNMQNFSLLKVVGKSYRPILLKRGLSATLKEFLMSAEYIMKEGNHKVILCERGIRTFCTYTRNTLDLNIIPALKKQTHLPVIVDPSHASGVRDFVIPMSKAAVAAGADGLIIEVHKNPEKSVSDKDQTLNFNQFQQLMKEIKPVAKAVGRNL
jgi:3-deoxy-7-phosphoheptulonate synthase